MGATGATGATGAMGAMGATGAAVIVIGLLCSTLWAQGRGGVASFPAQQRDPADPALIARGRSTYDTECRFCHGADLRGGERGGSNLLRSALVLNDREGESIQPALQRPAQGSTVGRRSQRRRHEGTGRLHSQRPRAGARAGGSSSRTARRAQGAGRRRRRRTALLRGKVRGCHSANGRSQRASATRDLGPAQLQNLWIAGGRAAAAAVQVRPRNPRQ